WRRRAEKRPPSPMGGRSRVVVAMSGGVDGAVAAARCRAAGHEVIGISLRLAPDGGGSCCSLDDFHDARAVADRLGFPHYVFDLADEFERRVIRPFVAEYVAGRTPNPCARCNRHLKFGLLWERARALGARWLATGHYARIATDPATGRPYLRVAVDAAKDQTYFLFALGAADLAHTLFPVGELSKAEVRAEAARLGLAVADKPESMEVCFVPGGDVAGFVERHAPAEALRPGPIVDETGRARGRPGCTAATPSAAAAGSRRRSRRERVNDTGPHRHARLQGERLRLGDHGRPPARCGLRDRGGRCARGRRDRQLLHRDRRRRRREPPPGTPRPAREPRRARHPDRLLRADEARRGGGRAGDRPRDRAQPPRCAGGRRHRAATASRARAGRQRPPGARRLDLRRTHLRGTDARLP